MSEYLDDVGNGHVVAIMHTSPDRVAIAQEILQKFPQLSKSRNVHIAMKQTGGHIELWADNCRLATTRPGYDCRVAMSTIVEYLRFSIETGKHNGWPDIEEPEVYWQGIEHFFVSVSDVGSLNITYQHSEQCGIDAALRVAENLWETKKYGEVLIENEHGECVSRLGTTRHSIK